MKEMLTVGGVEMGCREDRFLSYLKTHAVDGKDEGWTMPLIGTVADRAYSFANRWWVRLPKDDFKQCLDDFNAVYGLSLVFTD